MRLNLRYIANGTVWSILGVLLTIIFFYLTQERTRYDLEMVVEDEVNLVEVRERVEGLQINYEGRDLLDTGQQIRLLTIRIQNNGETILQGQYDQTEVFGVGFLVSRLLSVDVPAASSSYLRENLAPHIGAPLPTAQDSEPNLPEEAILELNKLILERDSWIVLRIGLLQAGAAEPTSIRAVGKIANIKNIPIQRRGEAPEPASSPLSVSIGLILGYALLIASLMALVILGDKVTSIIKARRVRSFIQQNPDITEDEREITEIYVKRWRYPLARLVHALGNEELAVDTRSFVETEVKRLRFLIAFLPPSRVMSLTLLTFPRVLIQKEGDQLMFSSTNREFILRFFSSVGILSEKSKDT